MESDFPSSRACVSYGTGTRSFSSSNQFRTMLISVAGESLRQDEVQHLHFAVRRDFDVRGFQVPVDDAFLVRGFEGFGDLEREFEGFFDRDGTTFQPLG